MRKIAILCDFDGTVAREDVGNLLFRTFSENGQSHEIVSRWKAGEISSRQCLEQEVALIHPERRSLEQFIVERKLDPYFRDFHDFATRRGMEVVIMSDGLDYYIERILCRNGLGQVPFFANRLELNGSGMRVTFPWYDMLECTDCGCCKTHHLMTYRQRGYFVIYVGDGLSDRCPGETADLVFAKGDLRRHCEANDISFVAFENFRDVEREVLKRIVLNGRFQRAVGE